MITWEKEKVDNACYLSGTDYTLANRVGLYTIGEDKAAVVLSVGKNPQFHSSGQANEDSAGAVVFPEQKLFLGVVADSHWGGLISIAVVKTMITALTSGQPLSFLKGEQPADYGYFFRKYLEKSIRDALEVTLPELHNKISGPAGATTVIVALVYNNTLYYGAIGDSVIYLFEPELNLILNSRNPVFLGEEYLEPEILECGEYNLRPGSTILLATDGLPECIYGKSTLSPEDLSACLEPSAAATACNLVERAFFMGGQDNLGLVVYQHLQNVQDLPSSKTN